MIVQKHGGHSLRQLRLLYCIMIGNVICCLNIGVVGEKSTSLKCDGSWNVVAVDIGDWHSGIAGSDEDTSSTLTSPTDEPSACSSITQLNSTSCNGRRCEHLFVRISMTLKYIYVSDITFTDLSPVSVRSAVKSYFTSRSIQNLSKRALNTLTELTSTTWLGKLFQILTIRAEK